MRLPRSVALLLLPGFLVACGGCAPESSVLTAANTGDLSLGPLPRAAFDARLDEACGGPGGTTEPGDQSLLRLPYLQKVGAGTAEVLWTADAGKTCQVRVRGADDGDVRTFPAEVDASAPLPQGEQLVARLEGLRSDATYCYQVVCDDGAWTRETGFRTAPATGQAAGPVRFVALGDLGQASVAQHEVAARMRETEFDFAVVTGDVAYPKGALESYESYFFAVYPELLRKAPFFVASGNHDHNRGPQSPFSQVFSLPENGGPEGRELWYSFDWGPVHVAVLDTERAHVNEVQASWLEADLAASDAPWKVVIGHRPPFSAGEHGDNRQVQRHFLPVLEKHRVPLALWGHDHNYERMKPINGVTHVVTGGGGKSSRGVRPTARTVFADPTSHFVHLTIDGDELRGFAIDATGRVFDTFRIQRPGSGAEAPAAAGASVD